MDVLQWRDKSYIQQDDRMCSTEEDEKKEGKIYTHTSGRLNI